MTTDLPTPTDILKLYRLIHELCEMGGDAYAWRGHLCSVLMPMIDADIAAAYVMKHPIDPADIGPRMPLSMHVAGNESWRAFVEQGDVRSNPITPAMMARMGTDFTCTRQELIDDQTWYAAEFHTAVATPAGWDQMLNSQIFVLPPGYVNGLGFMRAIGKPAFGAYESRLVHFVQVELARLWRRPDALGVHTLPDRQREVLDGIRRGQSRKTIAETMGVSDHTVHTYERALFERAGVTSRGELLASLARIVRPNLLP